MKHYCSLLLPLLFAGCVDRYDGETRILTDFIVEDSSGNPVSGQLFRVTVDEDDDYYLDDYYDDGYYFYNGQDHISTDRSDAEGRVRMVFPTHYAESRYNLEYLTETDEFEPAGFFGIRKEEFTDYRIPVNTITLYRSLELVQLTVTPQVPDGVALEWLDAEGPVSGMRLLHPEHHHRIVTNFKVKKNSTITIIYGKTTNGIRTEHSENVTIGDQNLNHNLNL